jgi:HK97 family phage major capsid protein
MNNAIEIKADTDAYTVYGGYGVVFGGRDLDGDTFTKDTDFQIDLVPSKPLFVDHTMDTELQTRDGSTVKLKGIDEPVGKVTTVTPDDFGLYIEFMVEKANRYWAIVDAMYNTGKMGLSSGAVAHLVRRAGGVIKRWPVVEWSATVSPAEPRTVQVQRVKAILDTVEQDDEPEVIPDTADAEPDPEAVPPAVVVEAEAKAVDDTAVIADSDEAGDVPAVEIETMSEQNFEALAADIAEIKAALSKPVNPVVPVAAPAVLTMGLGDNEIKALSAWYKRGDIGGVRHLVESDGSISLAGLKASNDTDMNIGTAADGGNAVPTGHYNGIIARRNEGMLTSSLRIMNIPGKGTTVNVPVDAEADGEFVSTNEVAAYDRDAPALGTVAMTLVKYTKKVELSVELLEDEDSQLMAWLNDFVGRGLAKTHNSLLLAEAANGTKLADFANTSIAAGKLEEMVGNTVLDPYLDDAGSVAWVMQPSTKWAINALLGSARIYQGAENVPARRGGDLLGYPVYTSAKTSAIGTGLKSVFFGNWAYMGFREAPGLTVLRDPYTLAATGQIRLVYAFRTVYKVLQATAIGYGLHA